MTWHPPQKMSLELVSVDDGWMRRHQCQICGKVKIGGTGKTLQVKGRWFCNGLRLAPNYTRLIPEGEHVS